MDTLASSPSETAQAPDAGRRAQRATPVEWPTVALIAAVYASWLAAGLLLWPAHPVMAFIVLALSVTLQSSLVHEALHGHPTRSARVNEALVFFPIGVFWPYRRFKTLHLRHHADERLTDPFDDPESYYQALWKHAGMPRWLRGLLRVNNTMVGRMIFGPWLSVIGLALGDIRLIRSGDRGVLRAWLLHITGLAVVVAVVVFGFGMPFWLYVIAAVWPGLALISIRTYAEHQWSEDPQGRTIIVEKSPLSFLFLNNNLHVVHHALPAVAWYRLPELYRQRRAEWIAVNRGYVFANYRALLSRYAFRGKEPVVHPVLRRTPQCGGAVERLARTNAMKAGDGTATPAE